jgi:hypothetical protein
MAQYVDQEGNPLWTIEEAAREWGVSPRRVYKWIKGRAGESKGLYYNRDGTPLRRFSRAERTRLPEGSYTLYPVGRKSIFLIRPQPYPEPILETYARPSLASHPEERTSLISYEANSANAKSYGYENDSISKPPFIDPYSDAAAMFAPPRERVVAGTKKQTRRPRRTQPVSDTEGRARRPLATQEEVEAAGKQPERTVPVESVEAKRRKKGEPKETKAPPPSVSEPRPGADQLPFYGFFLIDEDKPRVIVEKYRKFDDDVQAQQFAKGLLDTEKAQYVVVPVFGTNAQNPDIGIGFFTTPKGETNPKKFIDPVKEILNMSAQVGRRGAAPVYPAPEVVQPSAEPVAEAAPAIPETMPEAAYRGMSAEEQALLDQSMAEMEQMLNAPSEPEPEPVPVPVAPPAPRATPVIERKPVFQPPAPAPAKKPGSRAIEALLRAESIAKAALTKPPTEGRGRRPIEKGFTKLTSAEREGGVLERIQSEIADEISAGKMPEGDTEAENAWISDRARALLAAYRAQ